MKQQSECESRQNKLTTINILEVQVTKFNSVSAVRVHVHLRYMQVTAGDTSVMEVFAVLSIFKKKISVQHL